MADIKSVALCADEFNILYQVRLLKDKDTGQNKGYAFVTFTNKESAEKAIESLSDSELKVNFFFFDCFLPLP